MKKIVTVIIIIAIAAVAIFAIAKTSGQQFNAANENREAKIEWTEVNLRSTHSTTGEILDTLHKGDTVILTGYSFEYTGGDGEATESWVEVITHEDGTHGWVVTRSVDW